MTDDKLVADIVEAWQWLLPAQVITVDTDLFDLGIRSIHVIKVAAQLREMTGIDLAIGELFECRTPGDLAAAIRSGSAVRAGGAGDAARTGGSER